MLQSSQNLNHVSIVKLKSRKKLNLNRLISCWVVIIILKKTIKEAYNVVLPLFDSQFHTKGKRICGITGHIWFPRCCFFSKICFYLCAFHETDMNFNIKTETASKTSAHIDWHLAHWIMLGLKPDLKLKMAVIRHLCMNKWCIFHVQFVWWKNIWKW